MQWFKLVVIGMLVWGSQAFADLSPGGDKLSLDQGQISSWAARLNAQFADLQLQPRLNINDEQTVQSVLYDLETLETVLKDKTVVPADKLIHLACARAYCSQE